MKITEKEKQKLRKEGVFIEDFLKVRNMLKELGFSENLQKQFDNLIIPQIQKEIRWVQ